MGPLGVRSLLSPFCPSHPLGSLLVCFRFGSHIILSLSLPYLFLMA